MPAKKVRPLPATPEARAEEHRRQVLLQIWLPLSAALLVVLALVVLSIIGTVQGSDQINRWGSISAVLVIIPTLASSLISIALLFLIVYGLSKLLKNMPGWMHRLQDLFAQAQTFIHKQANLIVKPVMAAGAGRAGAKTLRKKLFR